MSLANIEFYKIDSPLRYSMTSFDILEVRILFYFAVAYDEKDFGIHQDSFTVLMRPGGIFESLLESRACKHRSCRLTGNERQYLTVNFVRHAVEHTIG